MKRRPSLVQSLLTLTLMLFVVACGAAPEERYAKAQLAAENKDQPLYLSFFTRKSAAFVRDMLANGARSKIHYIKDGFMLLPVGDVENVVVDGNAAILTVKGKSGAAEVHMFMENDEWSIDALSLPRLWEPLQENGQ